MPKYLIEATYTQEGARGLLEGGGTARRDAIETLLKSVGGRLEGFYFTFGETDAYVICDMPDNVTAAAVSLTVGAAGGAASVVRVLLTPEEIDQAGDKHPDYAPPQG